MLKMRPIDYDLVYVFTYKDNSFSIRCKNKAIISGFLALFESLLFCSDKIYWSSDDRIAIKNADIKLLSNVIKTCINAGLEYIVL